MIIIITGATHSGKTILAQKLLNKYHMPYISQDHIKMGLIRSGNSQFSIDSKDADITNKLWPITREMIKTAIENKQNLIVEGCYIPFTWKDDFTEIYLKNIKFICLCLSEEYITNHYTEIIKYENCIEDRINDGYCTLDILLSENKRFIEGCKTNNLSYVLIDNDYEKTLETALRSINIR